MDPNEIEARATLLLDEEYLVRDEREKAWMRRQIGLLRIVIAIVVLLLGGQQLVSVLRSGSTQDTAMKAATTAKSAAKAVNDKPSNADLEHTNDVAATAGKKATRLQTKFVTLTKTVHQTRVVLGLEGKAGTPGRNGRDATLPFTLQGLLDALSPLVVGRLSDRLDSTLPDVVRATCGGSCKGDPGSDGRDTTADQIDAAVDRHCAPLNDCVSTVPGPAGANSTVAGPAGPAGADSTVPGPQGVPGQDGAPGAPGTVVLSVQTACPDGNGGFVAGVATDPDGDGNFTCP